jgi:hypothetical protein
VTTHTRCRRASSSPHASHSVNPIDERSRSIAQAIATLFDYVEATVPGSWSTGGESHAKIEESAPRFGGVDA